MPELRLLSPPPREELLRGLRSRIPDAAPGWRLLAEDILGVGSRIDFVGTQPGGRALVVLVGGHGEDLNLVARALAQCHWLAERLDDWLQLNPSLELRPEAGVEALLLCPGYRDEAIAAAHAADSGSIRLATYRWVRAEGRSEPLVEVLLRDEPEPLPADELPFEPVEVPRPAPDRPREPASPFRTGLRDEDLGLTPEEISDLE